MDLLTIFQLPPCVPELKTGSQVTLGSLKLGKYSDVRDSSHVLLYSQLLYRNVSFIVGDPVGGALVS